MEKIYYSTAEENNQKRINGREKDGYKDTCNNIWNSQ